MTAAADLRARKLIRSWHEGVAIVRELADTLQRAGDSVQVPDLEHVTLDTSGRVEILGGSPPAGQPVRRLAATLEELIEGTHAPAELWALALENTGSTPKHATIGEFADALAIFERPGRRADIAQIVARAASGDAAPAVEEGQPAGAPSSIDSEISQLRDRARQARQARATRDGAVQRRRAWTGPIFIGGALLLIVYMGLATALWLQKGQHGPEAMEAIKGWVSHSESYWADIVRFVARTPGLRELPVVREALSASGPAESAPASSAPPPGTARAGTGTRRGGPAPAGSGAEPAPGIGAPSPKAELLLLTDAEALIARGGAEAERGSPPVAGAPVVYTSADPGVVPPTMVRQYLPSAAKARTVGATGVFDIVVSQTGEVERVRLISTNYQFHEKMLLAAAKAWRFEPARRDGRPVKCRVAVRITM